jgi:hypothetical protein
MGEAISFGWPLNRDLRSLGNGLDQGPRGIGQEQGGMIQSVEEFEFIAQV